MGKRFDVPPFQEIARKLEEIQKNINESGYLLKTSKLQVKEYLT